MKLSEAIRIGAAKRPQGFDFFVTTDEGVLCTCALGAAYEGVTGYLPTDDEGRESSISRHLDWLFPALRQADLWCELLQMNDEQRMTREEIAVWLEERGL